MGIKKKKKVSLKNETKRNKTKVKNEKKLKLTLGNARQNEMLKPRSFVRKTK